MSRQPIRQRPPVDDDLGSALDEEVRKQRELAAKKMAVPQTAAAAKTQAAAYAADLHPADRRAYFVARYAQPHSAVLQLMIDCNVPVSLHPCIQKLVHILSEKGLPAALEAVRHDAAIGAHFEGPVSRILMRLAEKEGRP